jgi:hypothetical protein
MNQLDKPIDLKSLPRNKARVEIAKDVLAALDAKRIIPGMCYLEGIENGPLKPQIAQRNCEVCAIGAVLVAVVARDNDFDVDYYYDICLPMLARLSDFFSAEELRWMEAAYEATCIRGLYEAKPVDLNVWAEFGARSGNRESRMRAIMQLIIDNKGKLVLT